MVGILQVSHSLDVSSIVSQIPSKHFLASGWKTARVVVPLFEYGVWVGRGNNVHVTCDLKWCYARATSWLGVWVGWGGAMPLMLLAITFIIHHYTNAPKMKAPEENYKFMTWEWQQLPNLESLLLRARCVFVPLVLWNVCSRRKNGRKRILVTDGAPCYPKLTCENNLGHEACNHSKGIFCIKKKKAWGTLLCTPVVSMECGKNPKVRCSVKFLEHTQEWNCKSSVASRNSKLAVVMAPWKFKRTNYMSLTGHAKRLWQK